MVFNSGWAYILSSNIVQSWTCISQKFCFSRIPSRRSFLLVPYYNVQYHNRWAKELQFFSLRLNSWELTNLVLHACRIESPNLPSLPTTPERHCASRSREKPNPIPVHRRIILRFTRQNKVWFLITSVQSNTKTWNSTLHALNNPATYFPTK